MAKNIVKAKVIEDSAGAFLIQALNVYKEPVLPADIAPNGLTWRVFDKTGTLVVPKVMPDGTPPTLPYTGTTLSPSTVFVTPVVPDEDPRWTDPDNPHNMELRLHGSYWPEAGTYQGELHFVPVADDPFYVRFAITAENIFSE